MLKFNNRVLNYNTRWLANKESGPGPVDPYNPLGLPPFTIRCKFTSGYTPDMGDSQALVDAGENIWDITKNDTDWTSLFDSNDSLISVLGANTTGVTNMSYMFYACVYLASVELFDTSSCITMHQMFYNCRFALTSVPLFDTSSVQDLSSMFVDCQSLTSVPLFNTSHCITMEFMFAGCTNVETGALSLYQKASTQTNPPVDFYTGCFTDCGSNTVTGAAELAQIPSSWGGTGS